MNKEKARAGESRTASRSSKSDISSGRRGGKRSGSGPGGRTREQLYNEAKKLNVSGRSKMSKKQLLAAVNRKRGLVSGGRGLALGAAPGGVAGAASRARPGA